MPTIEIKKYKCPKCGKDYEDSIRGHFSGKPCEECTQLSIKLNRLERQLMAEEFSLEETDGKIAQKIYALLAKESSGISFDDELVTNLVKIMLTDEKRRKGILKEILKLQKKKK